MGRYVDFDQSRYINALKRELDKAMSKVSKEVMTSILSNFGSLNVREMDRKYLAAMKRSIRHANTKTIDSFMLQFKAGMESQPNQSFRVVYYEYGTGNLMEPPNGYSPASDPYWNPARRDLYIWQRPRGKWQDAGGNWHTSMTKGAPRRLSPKSRRGTPVEPQKWFSQGFWTGTRNLDRYLHDAVKSVPISSYIRIAKIYKRL